MGQVLAAACVGAVLGSPALAAQPPDLQPYPPAGPGERRWFITVDTTPAAAGSLRVELIVGRTLKVDCNQHLLRGSIKEESLPGWGYPIHRVEGGEPMISTRMACPGQELRQTFVVLGGPPTLVPVNPRLPIVVVAPDSLEVRWRLWRAEPRQRPAARF
ncbi:MAG: ecotin family protein [Cyanobium sp.]